MTSSGPSSGPSSKKSGGPKNNDKDKAPRGNGTDSKFESDGAGEAVPEEKVIIVRKYANRRLYDTALSKYITLTDLAIMVTEGKTFIVEDAKSGEDMTRGVLTQIILEKESTDGGTLFPLSFLRQVIQFQGDQMQSVLFPGFLDMAVREFSQNQNRLQDLMQDSLSGLIQPNRMTELQERNMNFFRDAWSMMTGLTPGAPKGTEPAATTNATPTELTTPVSPGKTGQASTDQQDELRRLREDLAEMRDMMKELKRSEGSQ